MMLSKLLHKYTLLEWLLFGIIFSMNSPWIVWANNLIAVVIQYGCVLLAFIILRKEKRKIEGKDIAFFIILVMYFVLGQIFHEIKLSNLLICVSFLVAAQIYADEAKNVINLVTNYIFLSIIIPLPLWLIHIYIAPIPSFGIIDVGSWKEDINLIYENHIFFISVDGLEAMRFYSWYDEPGVLGTFAAFVLWANKFKMKDVRMIVILIGTLFTFSMAFYVLAIIGWLYNSTSSLKKFIITATLMLIVGYGAFSLLKDNLGFEQSVVNRVLNFDEKGVDSRIDYEVESLWKKAQSNNDLILGLGSGTISISRSYKCFILDFGYVGFMILVLAYYMLIKNRNLKSVFTLLIFILAFLQRPQMFTSYEFVLFSCIVTLFAYENQKERIVKTIKA